MVLPFPTPPAPSPDLPPELLALILGGATPPTEAPTTPPSPGLVNPALGPIPPLDVLGAPPTSAPTVPIPPLPPIPGLGQDVSLNVIPVPGLTDGADTERRKTPRRKKPTIDEVRHKCDRIVNFWQLRDQRMLEDELLYRMSKTVQGEGEVVIRNTPAILVDKAAVILGKQVPTIEVVPLRNDLRNEAQRCEDFLRYSWDVWNNRWVDTMHNSIRRDLGHFLALRGWAAGRINYDEDLAEQEEDGLPVSFIPFDPIQVYPMVGRNGLRYVAHRYEASIGEILDQFPEAASKFVGRDEDEYVQVTEYYDDWYHCAYTEQEVLKDVTAHEYGFVPWVIVTGLGAPIRATTKNNTTWVRDVGVSIFHAIKEPYRKLNKLLSQLATEVARAANPPMIYYYDPAQPGEPKKFKTEPGATNYLIYDREKAEPLNLSPNPGDVAPLIDALLDDINRGSLPSVLWGTQVNLSGFAQSLASDSAQDALFPLLEAMQHLMARVSSRCLQLIRDVHDGEVGYFVKDPSTGAYVGGVTIDSETIEQVGTVVRVKYRGIAPKDRGQMAQLAALLTDKKLISLETARDEYLEIENPERENERVLTDLVYLDDEVVRNVLIPEALKRAEPELYQLYLRAKEMAREEQQRQASSPGAGPSGASQPGAPPIPGLPPDVVPPPMMANTPMPMDLAAHSAASSAGGAGFQAPPGVPGAGALPLGTSIPGLM